MHARSVPIALDKSPKSALTVLDFCKKSLEIVHKVSRMQLRFYCYYYLLADVYTYS